MAGVANEGIALEALDAWGIEAPQIRLIKERENAVYSVEDPSGHRYALKLHRYGYHSDQELLAEYSWIAALNESGLRVPQPMASIEGSPLVHVAFEGRHHQLDLVPWIEAEPLAAVSTDDAGPDELRRIYTELGRLAARVHLQSQQWQVPAGFSRKAWDAEGLLGQAPLWGRFWELEALSPGQRDTVGAARAQAEIDLRHYAESPEGQASFSLIHADLVQDNVLVSDGALHLIDFDDAGFGWHLFELATALYFEREAEDFDLMLASMVTGYRDIKPLSDEQLAVLPLFFLLRSFTYLGWVHERPGSETAAELTSMLVMGCLREAEHYLQLRGS